MKNCSNCGKSVSDDALFCSQCGTRFEPMDGVVATEEQRERRPLLEEHVPVEAVARAEAVDKPVAQSIKKGRRIPVVSATRNLIILAVSIVMLVGAFLPFSAVKNDKLNSSLAGEVIPANLDDMHFTINTFKAITLLFDSTMDLDQRDIEDSSAYEQIMDMEEDLEDLEEDDFDHLTPKEKRLLNKLYYLTLRLSIQLGYSKPTMSILFAAILGVLHIALCVALLGFALFNLLSSLGLFAGKRAVIYKTTLALLTASPASILAAYYAFSAFDNGGLSGMALVCLIVSLLCIIAVMILRYAFSKKEANSIIVLRAITVALAIAVFCLAFAPVFITEYRTESKSGRSVNAKHSYGGEYFNSFSLTESAEERLEELIDMTKSQKQSYLEGMLSAYEYMEKKEILGEQGRAYNASIVLTLAGMKFEPSMVSFLSVGFLPFMLTAIAALIMLWQNLYFFVSGNYTKSIVLASKIAIAIFALLALTMGIVLVSLLSPNVSAYMPSAYHLDIGAGVIALVAVALSALFCSSRIVPKQKKAPRVKLIHEQIAEQF